MGFVAEDVNSLDVCNMETSVCGLCRGALSRHVTENIYIRIIREISPIALLMICVEWKSVYKSMESSDHEGFQALRIFPIEVVWKLEQRNRFVKYI